MKFHLSTSLKINRREKEGEYKKVDPENEGKNKLGFFPNQDRSAHPPPQGGSCRTTSALSTKPEKTANNCGTTGYRVRFFDTTLSCVQLGGLSHTPGCTDPITQAPWTPSEAYRGRWPCRMCGWRSSKCRGREVPHAPSLQPWRTQRPLQSMVCNCLFHVSALFSAWYSRKWKAVSVGSHWKYDHSQN